MWVLLEEPKTEARVSTELIVQRSQRKWGLAPGLVYKIGRGEKEDIKCKGDASVSKSHATISVISKSSQSRPEVVLEDVGSKYGTHLNDGILAESQRLATNKGESRALKKPRMLSSGDRVRFGVAYSIFRLMWIELEVTGSMLRDREERNRLGGWLEAVGSKLQDNMTDRTSHLVMSNISLSIKVVNCLAKGVPIVTSEFFEALLTCIKSRQELPSEENFVPPVSTNSSETLLRDPSISFQVNHERAKLFSGKRIIFVDKKQFQQNSTSCQLAGAQVIMWTADMDTGSITRDDVVIKPSSVSYKEIWASVSSRLASLSVASCPHTDLYLAIVHCSTEHYCNPARKSKLLGGVSDVPDGNRVSGHKILAAETGSVMGTPLSRSGSSRVQVSETLTVKVSSGPGASRVQTPLGETQVLETSSRHKRQRDSQEDEEMKEPPAKVANIDRGQSEDDAARCRSPDDMFGTNDDKVGSAKENNTKSQVELFSMSKQIETQDEAFNNKEDDEEDDLFGTVQPQKKRALSSPEKSQLNGTQQKRPRKEESIEDDMFGFEELKKEPLEPPIEEKMSLKLSVTPEVTNGHNINKEGNNKTRPDREYVEYSRVAQSSDGFIGKTDIKKERKDETLGNSEVSALSVTVAMISLLRPSSSKPRYVEHPDPRQHGRPVANFKRFKKQQIDKPRTVIALKPHVPGDNDQTRIEDWFKDNTVITAKEDEAEENSKKAEEFWQFESSQANRNQRKTNPFSRR